MVYGLSKWKEKIKKHEIMQHLFIKNRNFVESIKKH